MATAISTLPNSDQHPTTSQFIFSALSTSPHDFLQPSNSLHFAALLATKNLLDPLASDVHRVQDRRRQESRRKRKRDDNRAVGAEQVLQIREVYTDGFSVDQVWQQAKRVLDAARDELEQDLHFLDTAIRHRTSSASADGADNSPREDLKTAHTNEDELELRSDNEEEGLDGELLKSGAEEDESLELASAPNLHDKDLADEDVEDIERDDGSLLSKDEKQKIFVQDPNGLNDGFFSIDDFNKQSRFLEDHDARGGDDNPSDEDDIDWDADPLSLTFRKPKRGVVQDEDPEDNERSEEAGPTFDSADLNAPESDDGGGLDEVLAADDGVMPGLDNTNDIKYADFFEPPSKKPFKTKRMRALPKTQPPSRSTAQADHSDIDEDIERAISDVRRDLLDSNNGGFENEDSTASDPDFDESNQSSKDKNLSTHEKQKAIIAAEIRRLEAANVAKRDWTLSGEARAADRPMNSLIEEDLDFERVGKPVPVITAEVSEEIEQLIKRRILARDFDEVIRRRPDAVGAASDARRGRVELDDSKPQTGLAEVYEQEHLRRTDPGYVDKRSVAEKRTEEEISTLWGEISGQLDLLSNLHFKPKRKEVEIKVVGDKPTISMEDARPSGGMDQVATLAPQEIYRPGEEGRLGVGVGDEIMRKSGAAQAREEMSREEKLRRRRREKERGKKAKNTKVEAGLQSMHVEGNKKSKGQEKRDILSELRRGGVKVIGKKGQLEDVVGKKQHGAGERRLESGSGLKL